MTPRALARLLGGYAAALFVAALALRAHVSLSPIEPARARVVTSDWRGGALVGRAVLARGEEPPPPKPGATRTREVAVAEGPMWATPWLFALALVPGRDGVRAELDGKTAWITVDDLLAAQAYDHGSTFLHESLGIGTARALVFHLLGQRLGATPRDVEARATLRRVRFERRLPAPPERVTRASLTRARVTEAARGAARYLARGVDEDGRFRYLVLATSNVTVPGYNWPRHAGATYFLAQAAAVLDDPVARYAALRAAACLRDEAMAACGDHRCVASTDRADVGSSALALVAFAELVRTGADPSYRRAVTELAAFLRAQQRPDGELMHLYDRGAGSPVDVQYPYFTGEAALALSRAHAVTEDPRDLDAATRALAYLVGPAWSFFGSRYYFGEEHWTCQAAADLWDRAPNDGALAFCLRWHEFQRRLQYRDGESPFDADGAFGVGPVLTPRVTPAASRGEAAGAALEIVRREVERGRRPDDGTAALLTDELERAMAFVLRNQLSPGPAHLFADPGAVRDAVPGSPVDYRLRVDYAQHAGSMMIRWLELRGRE